MKKDLYLEYFKKCICNKSNEELNLKRTLDIQIAELLYNYFFSSFNDIDQNLIVKTILDSINNPYINYSDPRINKISTITIFAKIFSNILFFNNDNLKIIDIPSNLTIEDINFFRQFLFDYGLRVIIVDNKLFVSWKNDFEISNSYTLKNHSI